VKLPLRLFAYYGAVLGAIGTVPYLSVLLREAGLPDALVAVALAAIPIGALAGGPFWAAVADATGSPRAVLRVATALSVVAGGVLAFTTNGWAMAGALLVWSFVRATMPLADGIVIRMLAGDRRSYGRIRAFGSFAFLLVAWSGGLLRDGWARGPLFLSLGLLICGAVLAWTLPEGEPAPRARRGDGLLLVRAELPFLVVSVLHGVTLVCFDNFWSMHCQDLGLPSWYAGTGVALAVVVEMAVMIAGRRLLDELGPTRMIALAIAVGVPHWLLTGWVRDGELLVALQALRGVSFGAFWIAGVAWLSERAPAQLAASAQALLPSSSFGVGYLACMTLAAVVLEGGSTADLFWWVAAVDVLAGAALLAAIRRASTLAT
jgi:PPP family 3-phenylpropionic acid transporter